MKQFLQKYRFVAGVVGVVAAIAIATIYVFVVPAEAATAEGAAKFILLYGHSLCWVLLACAVGLWAFKKERSATIFAYAGLAAYALFMAIVVLL
jgi:hypothetical protein